MAFCSNCGEKMVEGAAFCYKCGNSLNVRKEGVIKKEDIFQPDIEVEKEDSDLKIKRCPSCGYGIPSFVASCPACGNEFRSVKNSDTLKKLVSQVDECEREIAGNQKKYHSGFMSWSPSGKIAWIIINAILFMVPLCFYFIWPMIRIKRDPQLTPEERKLVSLIENFPIPNDRESVLETLVYAKEKIDFISKERLHSKNLYWTGLWIQKAEQIKQKADLLFPKDEVVKKTYQEILKDKKSVGIKTVKKAFLGIFLFLIVSITVVAQIYNFNRKMEEERRLVIPDTELGRLLPELPEMEGKIRLSHSEYLSIEGYHFDFSSYEAYKKKCIARGFTIDSKEDGISYEAFNAEGYKLRVSCYKNELSINVNGKIKMGKFQMPNTKIAGLLPIPKSDYGLVSYSGKDSFTLYIGNTNTEDFNDYIDECAKKGFTENVLQHDNSYYADNKDGFHLSLNYQGFQTMYISIYKEMK